MKYLIILFLSISFGANAQWKSYKLTSRGDTINRIDLRGLKQGPWIISMPDLRGERGYEEEGYFTDDKKESTWRRFSLEGDVIAIENYRWGHKDGRNQYFTYQGEPLREEFWRAIDPKNPYDTVKVFDVNDPTKVIGLKVVKVESASVKNGVWKYFDPFMGKIEKTERWVMDRLKTNDEEDDDLAPIDVTNATATKKAEEKKPVTKPKEVLEFEKKNAGKKKIKVRTGSTGG
ncbi:MAG TPA: hypothetical protein VM368_04365 [Flavisolibacter sp.]|nr:hypothetical protein [Flavisolibacter sp.]